jgi:hypothetical protein
MNKARFRFNFPYSFHEKAKAQPQRGWAFSVSPRRASSRLSKCRSWLGVDGQDGRVVLKRKSVYAGLNHRRPVCDCPSVQPELNAELNAMSDDEFAAIIGAADQQMAQQLARAQACLDLFEKDRGTRATTALDIRVWADVQVPENLRFRILRRVRTAEVWTEACKRIWNDIPAPLASRLPMGQRIFLSPAEAAKTTGLASPRS